MSQAPIDIYLPPKCLSLFKPARYHVLYGGRGSTKSHSIARALLMMAMQKPRKILCAREFQNSINESVHALLSNMIAKHRLEPYFNIQNNSISCANGSEFIFKGLAHNIEAIKSMEGLDIVWLEEADRVSRRSWDTLIPTVRKPESFFIVSFNPADDDDPTYEMFVKNTMPNSIVTKLSYEDNPKFPEVLRAEMEYLKSVDFEKYLHVWEGHTRTVSDAQIFKGKYVVEEFSSDGVDNFRFGMDFGFANDPLCICRSFIKERRLYVDYAAYGYGVEIDDIPKILATIPLADQYDIWCDNSRPETISFLKNKGLRTKAARKWSGSVEDGIEFLRSFEKIVFHPRCKDAIYEAAKYSYKIDKHTGEILPIIVDANNHYWDSQRYALDPLIKRKSSIYDSGVMS